MKSSQVRNLSDIANDSGAITDGGIAPHHINRIGAKAFGLAQLQSAGVSVPAWFVVNPSAFHQSLGVDCDSNHNLSPAQLSAAVSNMTVDPSIANEIEVKARQLFGEATLVAVRSSAVEEDGEALSFAGQFESFLNVAQKDIADRVARVWKSCFSKRALAYRQLHGITDLPEAPAVLIQAMVDAKKAGVCFTVDPVSGNDDRVILSAVPGLADRLVSGELDGETIVVNRDGEVLSRQPANSSISPVTSVLNDDEVERITRLALAVEGHLNRPQDLEWAIDGKDIFFVQARPITSIGPQREEGGQQQLLSIWDNSNIGESYQGVTTPLTFSFARKAYEHVYIEFCRLMSVSEGDIDKNCHIFPCMLGFIRGRIYYNLSNWYRLLAMLPGYSINRRFMEQMMGVKEGIPDEILNSVEPSAPNKIAFLQSIARLVFNLHSISQRIGKFNLHFESCMKQIPSNLESVSAQTAGGMYRRLESQLLTRWDAPLINDFYAMIFFGLLKTVCKKWLGDEDETLQNQLVSSTGEIISAEPARMMRAMARIARGNHALVNSLQKGSLPAIVTEMEKHPSFKELYTAYLDKFGDRCINELKLESATVCDDPLLLLRSVGSLATRRMSDLSDEVLLGKESREKAERQAYAKLSGQPINAIKTILFAFILKQARERLRDRENLRFQRTRLFGKVRQIFRAIGNRLAEMRVLKDAHDVFYLEVNEVLSFLEGTSSSVRLSDLVELRKKEFEEFASCHTDSMPGRLTSVGIVYVGFDPASALGVADIKGATSQNSMSTRKGIGCCAGRVKGRARLITDPREAELKEGEILVCERTDPGWILLFSQAAGILVEHGSLLSHTAIVSRELGIPAIVSVPGLMSWIKDGDLIEFDGTSGLISLSGDHPMQPIFSSGAERSA